MSDVAAALVIVWFMVSAAVTSAAVGKPRKPLDGTTAAVGVIVCTVMSALVAFVAWGAT